MEPEHLTSGGAVAVPFEEGAASADGSEVWLPRVLGPEGAAAHAVVVGTARSALGVLRQLRTLDDPPTLAGWIDAGDGTERAAGLHRLGSVDELASVCARAGTAMAIVCLPASEQSTIQRVRAELRRCGVVERFVPPLDEMLAHAPAPLSVGGGGVSAAIDPATLVGRVPRAIDMGLVEPMVRAKRVLDHRRGRVDRVGAGADRGEPRTPTELVLVERSPRTRCSRSTGEIASAFPGVNRRRGAARRGRRRDDAMRLFAEVDARRRLSRGGAQARAPDGRPPGPRGGRTTSSGPRFRRRRRGRERGPSGSS
jgi:hypothetical protein